MDELNQFRATLAASLLPLFQGGKWFNRNGASTPVYYAKLAVEVADAIIAEVLKKERRK